MGHIAAHQTKAQFRSETPPLSSTNKVPWYFRHWWSFTPTFPVNSMVCSDKCDWWWCYRRQVSMMWHHWVILFLPTLPTWFLPLSSLNIEQHSPLLQQTFPLLNALPLFWVASIQCCAQYGLASGQHWWSLHRECHKCFLWKIYTESQHMLIPPGLMSSEYSLQWTNLVLFPVNHLFVEMNSLDDIIAHLHVL